MFRQLFDRWASCPDNDAGPHAGPHRRRCRFGSLLQSTGGVSAVEFALSVPLLLGLLVPVADLGIAYSRQLQVEQAVQAGALYASSHPWNNNSPSEIRDVVLRASRLSGLTVTPAPFQVCGCPDGSTVRSATCGSTCPSPNGQVAGYYATISAQLPYTPVVPLSLLGSTTLTAQTIVRVH